MKYLYALLCLLLFISCKGIARETNKEQTDTTTLSKIEKLCLQQVKNNFDPSFYQDCLTHQKSLEMEKITVHGRYIGIEVPEVEGRFHLNRDFIENAPKTGGDINDLIALLPGVQTSNDAESISNLQEISAQQISISGAQPWQTGFYIDGMNYNNRVDPGSQTRTTASVNDVTGGVQTMNINSQIISSINVYDNNIPVQFGDFSGGIVEAKTLDPFVDKDVTFSFGYRGNQSDWVDYHFIEGIVDEEDENSFEPRDFDFRAPEYKKQNFDMLLSKMLNKHHGLTFSLSYSDSVISDLSLAKLMKSKRKNINLLAKYSFQNGWIDKLSASVIYAPYTSEDYLKNVKDSEYTLNGGSIGSTLNLSHTFERLSWSSKLNYSQSHNSREAPAHFYKWVQAKGKEWGKDDLTQSAAATPLSKEGGYGNLDNTQNRFSWSNQFNLAAFELFGFEHLVTFGNEFKRQAVERYRRSNHYDYFGPFVYSTGSPDHRLNCSGYQLDCTEIQYNVPLEQFIEQLGGLDFTNVEHIIAYSNNVLVTPQYFQLREVIPAEQIDVNITKSALYLSNNIESGDLSLTLGIRYDWDDFYKNHNIASRNTLGYDLFSDGSTLLILGASRYYSAGLLNYKIKEQQKPSYDQFRPVANGYLQGWQDLSSTPSYRYRFTNVKTPYDDELVFGFKQATDAWGNFSTKFVRRFKRNQLTRAAVSVPEDDGYHYIQMVNEGKGHSKRVSFSWNGQFAGHSFWFNTSISRNYNNASSYKVSVLDVPNDEIVNYRGELITRVELDVLADNFAKPLIYNFGWSKKWNDILTVSATATHSQSYTTPIEKGTVITDLKIASCSTCQTIAYLEVPNFIDIEKRGRTVLSLSAKWRISLPGKQKLELNTDIRNLFNARTYAIEERTGQSGIEPGRQYWFGVKYQYD